MLKIQKISNNELELKIRNQYINPSLVNTLRRIMLGEIPIYAIDYESINFERNNTIINSDQLAHRLILIPINFETLQDYLTRGIIDDFEIYYNTTNNTETMMNVYTSDFTYKFKGDVIPGEHLVFHQDILFTKIKPKQTLTFSAKLKQSTSLKDGPAFIPVSQATFYFERDQKEIQKYLKSNPKKFNDEQKKNYLLSDADRLYMKNKRGEPELYNFLIETNDNITPINVFLQCINVLKNKLRLINEAIETKDTSKIKIGKADVSYEAFDFQIMDEDDTLGNLMDKYLEFNTKIHANGYVIPHPFDKLLVIRTQLKTSNTLKNNVKVFQDTLSFLLKIIEKLEINFKKESSKHKINVEVVPDTAVVDEEDKDEVDDFDETEEDEELDEEEDEEFEENTLEDEISEENESKEETEVAENEKPDDEIEDETNQEDDEDEGDK